MMKQHVSGTSEMIDRLKHLLKNNGADENFVIPSMLTSVPSITTSDTAPLKRNTDFAELGRRT